MYRAFRLRQLSRFVPHPLELNHANQSETPYVDPSLINNAYYLLSLAKLYNVISQMVTCLLIQF